MSHAVRKHDGVLCPANGLGHNKSTTLASLPWSACSQHIDWVGLLGIEGEDWIAICTLPHLSFKAIKATTCLNPSPRGYSLPAGIVQKPLRFEAYGDCKSYLGAPMKIFSWAWKCNDPCEDICGKFCWQCVVANAILADWNCFNEIWTWWERSNIVMLSQIEYVSASTFCEPKLGTDGSWLLPTLVHCRDWFPWVFEVDGKWDSLSSFES